jgi:predicted Ser/Thr protein kinase
MVDSLRYLQAVGSQVQETFLKNKTILSFQEYLEAFGERSRVHARSAAQYIRDCFDHYGTTEIKTPAGNVRRFKLFDRPFDQDPKDPAMLSEGEGGAPVSGQEDAQNAIYRILNTFVRAGRVNKLILLHGPNGSAKSTIVAAIQRALEDYSRNPEGALYRYNWVFPSEKLGKGAIGFGDAKGAGDGSASYAHLEGDEVDARIPCEMKDHPLWLVPRRERRKLLEAECKPDGKDGPGGFILSPALLEGELCHKCRQIYAGLIQSYNGDILRVLRHVQVERFYVSRRYMQSAVTVEPQMSVDADVRQLTADRSHHSLPGSLQNMSLFESYGPLVAGNRGLVEFSDLLKRPLEHYKYLLGTIETGVARMSMFLLHLDTVLIASSNEKHLSAFKEISDFPSFKGRIELVRVPYLRRASQERAIYDQQITPAIGKHVAPHATDVAAQWAVLTRVKKPVAERYKGEQRKLIDHLGPLEKMRLYDTGATPDRLSSVQGKELRKLLNTLWHESDTYPNYEGRSGASAREVKTVFFNAAQNVNYRCLTPQAILEELEELVKDKSVYEFLQQEVIDGYHDHEEFVRVVEGQYLDALDEEVREAMGLVSERQYAELFERYVQHVVAWTRGERLRNRVTGELERPDDEMMAQTEAIISTGGEDRREFRRGLISAIGAHRIENPQGEIDYSQIFPDLFRRLRDHFYDERKRTLRKNSERVLRYLGDERSQLDKRDVAQVESTLNAMKTRYGYCEHCAKDALVLLLTKRYND